ncbi:putative leucine-rich repeat domain, L domain-containing protein [Medicago truncatula]|uniref:Putative leucine-rich repeat domain, L domain-containing protein n=1 Tax=Medicago truncatula TaxID=3880 RepID=A0A396GRU1_MEDTR|nr:putative leucine-rich repeat domain, L domain-containing protein [Medicago truncatula]
MKKLEIIGPEFYYVQAGEGSNSSFQPFPSLEHIKLHKMSNWKEWIPFKGSNFAFPRLRILTLHDCPKHRRHLPSHLSSIEEIEIKDCAHLLETTPAFPWLSPIKKMKIKKHTDSLGYSIKTPPTLLENDSPCILQHVTISHFYDLFALPKMIFRSYCLQHLELYAIQSLIAVPLDGLPTSLRSLAIVRCKRLAFMPPEICSNYTSLESLWLRSSCDALKSFPLDGFPVLQRLNISGCRSLDSIFILESPSPRPSSL